MAVNFWDYNVWALVLLVGVLLGAMVLASLLKKWIKPLKKTLMPGSVLGGLILLLVATIYWLITKKELFDLAVFSSFSASGLNTLEIITYHCLGIGFIAMALRDDEKKFTKKRAGEVFDSGVTTVSGYLIQGVFGIAITIIIALIVPSFFKTSGLLLPFGYGQGTGQALNYGKIYEATYGFTNGANFGLSIAALGFLSASVVGVIYLNILRRKGKIQVVDSSNTTQPKIEIEDENGGSMDKLTVNIAICIIIYMLSYLVMWALSLFLPEGIVSVIYGFNFLIGTLIAVGFKAIYKKLRKKGVVKKNHLNTYMMNRIGGFSFDLMIIAGIGAIQISMLKDYWWQLLILGIVGALVTFFYVYFISKKLFKEYKYEQFFAMFGMLTGTASTGVILLREIDPKLESPASDNLVYQTLPAIVFGFPMMFLATWAPQSDLATYLTMGICAVLFIALQLVLFRRQIFFRKKYAMANMEETGEVVETENETTSDAETSFEGDSGTETEIQE